MNRTNFYNRIRNSMFNGELSQAQVTNIEAILNEYERLHVNDIRKLAYVLGTVYHETAGTMEPIAEYGKGKGRKYGLRVDVDGKSYSEPHLYYGRGHTQNTWRTNYSRLTKKNPHGWDFVNNPDLLLQVEPSIWATWYAMILGLYTGKRLSHYFNLEVCDWTNARRIINGVDCAEKIAQYSKKFYLALQ